MADSKDVDTLSTELENRLDDLFGDNNLAPAEAEDNDVATVTDSQLSTSLANARTPAPPTAASSAKATLPKEAAAAPVMRGARIVVCSERIPSVIARSAL